MNRRNFLRIAGGGVVLAATGVGGILATSRPSQALAPWTMAGSTQYSDPRLHALSYAILAPNPHNRQPWLVDLDSTDALTLYFDTERQLEHTDPFDRQLTIGLGCFLELMVMAAGTTGHAVDLELFPEGESAEGLDNRPIAHALFRKSEAAVDPLWRHVPDRRSNKEPFDTARDVSTDTLESILSAAHLKGRLSGSVAQDDIAYWRDLTSRALMIEIETPRTFKESVDLFRIGKREVNANPDGIDFSGPMFEALHLAGVMTREASLDTTSTAYTSGIDAVIANTETAMGHLWLVTDGNSRRDQIATGADWLRINLACTGLGISFQPLSQALQEYPEMADIYDETHARLAPDGGTVQMLARIGYGPEIEVSPRWPIEAKLGAA